jgi:DNA-binding HxlR family transcriptional regulator
MRCRESAGRSATAAAAVGDLFRRLVTRTVVPTVPVTVSYELTNLGLSLHQMMRGLKTWAELHMDDVLLNRETYDGRG